METLKGTIQQIKLVKLSEQPLVYFRLNDRHCLIAKHSLSFLAEAEVGAQLAVAGYTNTRQQFIVQKYAVLGKTKIMMEFDQLNQQYSNKLYN
ncbi:hypothetical protein NRIC_29140 [Enterococcus florum]|uniref:Uncharacterized protein n=1 Tax=Enterococcus florum TaxID=2480627 RepID=A0A4P5PPJ8_9ENTE|nr:hypothetical protein [Enterococcus florum]GCF95023.1 hypothetical protein NRIC_29140 [Enterococcus florum]